MTAHRDFGSLRGLPSGRWQARYVHLGARHTAPRTFKTRADAKAYLRLVEADIHRGAWADPALARKTVKEWAERWQGTTVHLKPKTLTGYDSVLRVYVLPYFGPSPVSRVDTPAVKAFIADLSAAGHGPSTIAAARKVLRLVLSTAVDSKALLSNPCNGVKVPRGTKPEMHFLDANQIEDLCHAIGHPKPRKAGHDAAPWWRTEFPEYAVMVRFAAYSGLRAGEIAGLRVRRVDLLHRKVQVAETLTEVTGHGLVVGNTKTSKVRAVPLPRFVCDELALLLIGKGADDYVFTSPEGGPLRYRNFYDRHFKPAVLLAGLASSVRFHDLRHTYAGLLIGQGAHPRAIMERLGHSSITVTLNTYGHLLPGLEEHLTDALDTSGRAAQKLWARSGHAKSAKHRTLKTA